MPENNISNFEDARILVVDDSLANLALLQRILMLSGYKNIQTLSESRMTLQVYQEFQPDLLLIDLKMPFMDGFDVLKELKNHLDGEYLPAIMITAQNDQENRLEALAIGVQDFISKPFNHTEVLARIQNFLSVRFLHNRLRDNNTKLEEKVRVRTRELSDMQIEVIERLLRAAEFRDEATGGHINRIGSYAYMLAKKAGCAEEYANTLFHASKMHDIGKIGIPDEILLKKGSFTDQEHEIMKMHSEKGAQILSGSKSPIIKMGEKIALTHHEKWDGTGYPNGLKMDEIPLEGRITAICDVFDALISWRPYKTPWTVERAIEEIRTCSGTHFDPALVRHFAEDIEKILKVDSRDIQSEMYKELSV